MNDNICYPGGWGFDWEPSDALESVCDSLSTSSSTESRVFELDSNIFDSKRSEIFQRQEMIPFLGLRSKHYSYRLMPSLCLTAIHQDLLRQCHLTNNQIAHAGQSRWEVMLNSLSLLRESLDFRLPDRNPEATDTADSISDLVGYGGRSLTDLKPSEDTDLIAE